MPDDGRQASSCPVFRTFRRLPFQLMGAISALFPRVHRVAFAQAPRWQGSIGVITSPHPEGLHLLKSMHAGSHPVPEDTFPMSHSLPFGASQVPFVPGGEGHPGVGDQGAVLVRIGERVLRNRPFMLRLPLLVIKLPLSLLQSLLTLGMLDFSFMLIRRAVR